MAGLGGLLPPTSVKWSTIVRRRPTLDKAPSLVSSLSLSLTHTYTHWLERPSVCAYIISIATSTSILYTFSISPCTQQSQYPLYTTIYLHTTTINFTLYPCIQQQSISHYYPCTQQFLCPTQHLTAHTNLGVITQGRPAR